MISKGQENAEAEGSDQKSGEKGVQGGDVKQLSKYWLSP